MSLAFPAITGTTRNVANIAEFNAAIAAAGSGDEIVLADGTYTVSSAITASSFTTNGSQGGITIRSASNNPVACVLSGNGFQFQFATTSIFALKGIGIVSSSGVQGFNARAGNYRLENIRITGDFSSEIFSISDAAGDISLDLLDAYIEGSGGDGDLVNGFASGTNAFNVRLIRSTFKGNGNTVGQVLTGHLSEGLTCWGCSISDSIGTALIESDATGFNHLFFCDFGLGAIGTNQLVRKSNVLGCKGGNFGTDVDNLYMYCSYTDAFDNQFRNYTFTSGLIRHNYFIGDGTENRHVFNNGASGGTISSNIFDNLLEAVLMNFAASPQLKATLSNNTYINCTTALNVPDSDLPLELINNACLNNTTSINTSTAAFTTYTGGNNIFDPAVDADYTGLTGDVLGVDADLDESLIPVANGNADNGSGQSTSDPLGLSDWAGLPYLYSQTAYPVGARARPISDGDLYPDAV
ncbi:hypothetical protein Lepto7375DRAFT_1765 [Leptolyngbya sp. PCC 7375]|nr:hypothetical protein Lepto7375DRAFT_1765 [Leptolyngbya sp. PCC 7375]